MTVIVFLLMLTFNTALATLILTVTVNTHPMLRILAVTLSPATLRNGPRFTIATFRNAR